jgi:hypothetical protein
MEVERPAFKNHGVNAETLVSLVENTAPFLFEPSFLTTALTRYAEVLRKAKIQVETERKSKIPSGIDSDLWSYFELAISAHFATVGTFVPTDVDLAIRQKLWATVKDHDTLEPMWDLIQEFKLWDESPVSRRTVWVSSGGDLKKLSGLQGEWFTIAMAAYGTALKVAPEFVPEIRNAVEDLVKEHEVLLTQLRAGFAADPTIENTRAYLDGVAAVAHNLGDLDRMFDLWEIGELDVLKRRVYRSGHANARTPRAVFVEAGKVYQELLANENHRHFALREPKGIRHSSNFLLTYGPFLDDWGKRIVKEGYFAGSLGEGDLRDVVEALVHGWKRLNTKSLYHSQGYARALCGIAAALGEKTGAVGATQQFTRGRVELENLLPPAVRKELTQGGLKTLMNVTRTQFENQWIRKLETVLADFANAGESDQGEASESEDAGFEESEQDDVGDEG